MTIEKRGPAAEAYPFNIISHKDVTINIDNDINNNMNAGWQRRDELRRRRDGLRRRERMHNMNTTMNTDSNNDINTNINNKNIDIDMYIN